MRMIDIWRSLIMALALTPALTALDGTVVNVPLPSSSAPQRYGFVLYKPAGYDAGTASYPLVVGLHGVGHEGTGSDSSLTQKIRTAGLIKAILKGRDVPALVVTPQALSNTNGGKFDPNAVGDLINFCKTTYRVDAQRVTMTGFSAGGGTAMQVAYFKGGHAGVCAAVVCAPGLSPIAGDMTDEPQRVARMPLWFIHNWGDPTVDYRASVQWCDLITTYVKGTTVECMDTYPHPGGDTTKPATSHQTGGFNSTAYSWTSGILPETQYPEFTLRNSNGHGGWDEAYQSDTFWTWILARSNTAPTISAIADRTVPAGTSTGAIAFTIDDADMMPVRLTVTRTSSNTTVVPLANITLGGSAANRTITAVPASGQTGSSLITVTVSDGITTTSESFTLTVGGGGGGNTAPTISDVADRSLLAGTGGTGAISVTVGDAETTAGSLTLTRASSNTTLVPTSNVVLGGSGATRTVTVTPASGQTGSSTITLTVTDAGGLTATDTFVVTVTANTAPTVGDIANQTIASGSSTGAIAFTIGDAETPGTLTVSASSSNLTLVPSAGIVLGGSGTNRTIAVTPASGQTGTATITVTVSDGVSSAVDTFTVTVSANAAPTITAIANQTVTLGNAVPAITFTIGDDTTPLASLVLTGSSTNTTLLPNAGLAFGGSGASRTLTLTPASGISGVSTVTVTVTDANGLTATRSFTLTVNAPPTINAIADQSTIANVAVGPLAFTIDDTITAPGSLTLSTTSSNTALAPLAGISLGGSGASRSIAVTPASGQTGSATITITVTDGGGLSASEAFVLTVTANTAPTISNIANQTMTTGTTLGPIAFTIGDAETSGALTVTAASGTITVLPNSGLTLGGSGTSRTLAITPISGQTGTVTVTVTVSDGVNTATDTFTVAIAANTAPTITSIANQSVVIGNAIPAIAITVGDDVTPAGSLSLTGTSGNTTLIPNANLTFAGSGSSRTLTIAAASGVSGVSTITVIVTDGNSLTASRTFTVTVNAPPTISAIADQTTTTATAVGPLAFTIGDAITPAGSLVLTTASGNTTLLPSAGIALGGSGASRTVTVTPASGQTGTATITITVSDGSLSAIESFVLTVNAPPAQPALSVNFQPSAAPSASGYFTDSGAVFADRGNGNSYGWNSDRSDSARDRNIDSNQSLDTFIYAPIGSAWEAAVPNGTWTVTLVCGDPAFGTSTPTEADCEGDVFTASPTSGATHVTLTGTVIVTDGRFTLRPVGRTLKCCRIVLVRLSANT